jgi:hypothetical protein
MKIFQAAAALGLLAAALAVPGAASSAAAARPVRCTNAELVASYHRTDAATSHRFGRLVLTNTSDHACRTGGYGGLSYVGGGDGTQIGAPADREPGRARSIVVRPGERVVSRVSATVAAVYPRRECRPAHVDGFRVYVPDETHAQFVAHPTRGCRNPHVHLLTHRAYRA